MRCTIHLGFWSLCGALLVTSACVSRTIDGGVGADDVDDCFEWCDDGIPQPDDDGPVPPPPDDDGPVPQGCPSNGELFGDYVTVQGSTANNWNEFGASCAPADGPDAHYIWVTPYDGEWSFDTFGSSFDTILTVQFDECSGDEFACSDDVFDLTSQIVTFLPGGVPVTIVVDGFEGEQGNYQLNISPAGDDPPPPPPPPMCEVQDFGVTEGFLAAFNVTGGPIAPPSCISAVGPHAVVSWTAAVDGVYRIVAEGENKEPGLVDRRTFDCDAPLCDMASITAIPMKAGETATIGVEVLAPIGTAGYLNVSLDKPVPPPDTCPQYALPGTFPAQTTEPIGAGVDAPVASCTPVAPKSMSTFRWRAPGYGDVTFSASGSDTLAFLTVQETDCTGAEVACVVPTGVNGAQAQTTVAVKKGRDYIVTVGSYQSAGTDVTIEVF